MLIRLNSNLLLLAGITLTLLEIDRLYYLQKVLMTKNNVSLYLVTPPTFNVNNCYQIKLYLLILLKSY